MMHLQPKTFHGRRGERIVKKGERWKKKPLRESSKERERYIYIDR